MDTTNFDAGAASANQQIQGMASGFGGGFMGLTAMRDITSGLTSAIGDAANAQQLLVNANALLTSSFDAAGKSEALNAQGLDALRQQAEQTAATYGQSMNDVASAVYQAVSSGFTLQQAADGSSQAMDVVNAGAQAAVAGMTSVDTATTGLITTLNALGLTTNDIQHVEDTWFQTVNQGVLTYDQLNSSLGANLVYAKQMGVTVDELGGAYASMTLQGQDASSAATQQASLFRAFLKPTTAMSDALEKYTGIQGETAQQWLDSIPPGQHLAAMLDFLTAASDGNSQVLSKMLGRTEALAGYYELASKGTSDYTTEEKKLEDALHSGSPEMAAYQEQLQGTGIHLQITGAALAAMRDSLVQGLLPAVKDGAQAVTGLATAVMHLPENVQTGIAAFVGLTGTLGTLSLAARFAGPLLAGIVSPELIAGLAIGGGLIAAYEGNFLGFADAVNAAGSALSGMAATFSQVFGGDRAAGVNVVSSALDGLAQAIGSVSNGNPVLQAVAGSIERLALVSANAAGVFANFVSTGVSPFNAAILALGSALTSLTGNGALEDFTNRLVPALDNLGAALQRIGSVAATALQPLVTGLGELAKTVAGNALSGIGNALLDIANAAGSLSAGDVVGAVGNLAHAVGDLAQIDVTSLGTVGAALKNIGETIKTAFTSIDWGAVSSAIQTGLQNASTAFMTWANQQGGELANDFQSVNWSGVATAVGTGVMNALRTIGSSLSGAASVVGTALQTALSSLPPINLPQLASSVGAAITTALGQVGNFLSSIAATIGSAIQSRLSFLPPVTLPGVASSVGAAITTALGTIGAFLGGIAASVGAAIQGKLADISIPALTGLAQKVGQAIVSAINGVGNFLGGVASSCGAAIVNALQGINLSGAITAVQNLAAAFQPLETAVSAVADHLQTLASQVGGWMQSIGQALSSVDIGGVFSALEMAVASVVGGLTTLAGSIGGWMQTIATAISKADWGTAFKDLGTAVSIAWSGITQLASGIGGWMQTIAAAVSKVNFGTAWSDFAGVIGNIKTDIAGLAQAIASAVPGIISALSGLKDQVLPILQAIGDAMAKIGQGVASLFSGSTVQNTLGAIPLFGQGITQMAGMMGQKGGQQAGESMGQQLVDQMVQAINSADWGQVGAAIQSKMAAALQAGLQGGGGSGAHGADAGAGGAGFAGSNIGQTIIAGLAQSITGADWGTVTNAIQAGLTQAFSGGGGKGSTSSIGQTIGKQLMTDIGTAIGQGTQTVETALQTALQVLTQVISTTTNQWILTMSTTMTAMATAVTNGMNTVQSAILSGLQTATTQISTTTNQWVITMSTTITAMATAVTNGMGQVVAAVQAGMQQAVAALQAAAAQAQAAGADFAAGFAAGISSGTGAVAAAASQLAATAMSSLKAGIQSASPSKLTNLEGQNFGAGFQQGIQSTGGAVQQAAQGIAQQAIQALGLPTAQSAMQQVVGSLGKAADAVQQTAQGMSQLGQATQSLTDATKSLYGAPTASGLQQGVFGNLPPAVQSYFGSWDAIQKVIDATLKPASLPTRPTNTIASHGSAPTNNQPTTLNATLVLDGGGFNKAVLGTALAPLIPAAQNVGSRGTVRGQ